VCAGAGYVVGFTILQENVEDELRGRIFAALYTLVRLCLIVSLTLAPLLSGLLNGLSNRYFNRQITVGGFSVGLPGGRLTLWLGSIIIIVAGLLASRAMRVHLRERAAPARSCARAVGGGSPPRGERRAGGGRAEPPWER